MDLRALPAVSHQPPGSFPLLGQSLLAAASDCDLAQALIAGSPNAPVVAWSRFSPPVTRISRRGLGPHAEIEDAAQEVFLRLFRHIDSLRDPGALRWFVTSIAVRTLRSELRHRRAHSWLAFAPDRDLMLVVDADADLGAQHALVRFYRLLDRVNERDGVAFVLHFVEGMEATEVALTLGVSEPTARRRFLRARKRLMMLASRDSFVSDYVAIRRAG